MADQKRPAEFPTDWHFQAHLEGLERELLGYQRRIAELPEDALQAKADAESGLAAVRAELKKYGQGQKSASTRPKAPQRETRSKRKTAAKKKGTS